MAGVRQQIGFGDFAFDGGQGELSGRPVEDFNVKFPRLPEEMKKVFSGLARTTPVPRCDELGTAIAIRCSTVLNEPSSAPKIVGCVP